MLDHSRTLCRREVSLVNVLWSQQGIEKAAWEREDEIRQCFPKLFPMEDDNMRYKHTLSFLALCCVCSSP